MEEIVLQVIKWLGIAVLTVTVGGTLAIFAAITANLCRFVYRRLRNENSKAESKAH